MPGIGLVLAGGGVAGRAYHSAVLRSLERRTGWDPRHAHLIVGTSAGSIIAAHLRAGVSSRDLLAVLTGEELHHPGLRAAGEPPEVPFLGLRSLIRPAHVPSPRLLAAALRHPDKVRPALLMAALSPPGRHDLSGPVEWLHELLGPEWPEGLWITATRTRDMARVVLGQPHRRTEPVATAVAASCAIPGVFTPVQLDGRTHVDGGMHSASNLDVVAGEGLDLVVAVSPMSASSRRRLSPELPLRWALHQVVERERAAVEATGTAVLTIEPGPLVQQAMGVNFMDRDREGRIVEAAVEEVADLADRGALDVLTAAVATTPAQVA